MIESRHFDLCHKSRVKDGSKYGIKKLAKFFLNFWEKIHWERGRERAIKNGYGNNDRKKII